MELEINWKFPCSQSCNDSVPSPSGIPAMVDLTAMRDAVAKHGVDPSLVNPKCPTDLIVDHSLQIDYNKWYVYTHPLWLANSLKWWWSWRNLCINTHSAIQNAPNPGGGDSTSRPSRSLPRGGQCGGQRGSCGKAACSDPPASAGRAPVQQIENTPLLCPFHMQPVSE